MIHSFFVAVKSTKKQIQDIAKKYHLTTIIVTHDPEEAIEAMSETLDENGYKDQYIFQTFGTSELGGKLLAEGKNLEADMVTMSTFYVDSAQEENKMFKDLEFDVNTLDEFGTYCAPITSQEGTIINKTVKKGDKIA